jgi:hypothetical protein
MGKNTKIRIRKDGEIDLGPVKEAEEYIVEHDLANNYVRSGIATIIQEDTNEPLSKAVKNAE